MSDYQVLWVASAEQRRDYYERQAYANDQKCILYVEHHFNAAVYDKPGVLDNPALCLVGSNAGKTSVAVANHYSSLVAAEFGNPNRGVVKLALKGRGDYNLRFTHMPAVLVEPLYVSDVEQALIAQSAVGQEKLAGILVETIRKFFPAGGKVAFSVGHKFKVKSPHDRGAPVVNTKNLGEADLAEQVLKLAATMLEVGT